MLAVFYQLFLYVWYLVTSLYLRVCFVLRFCVMDYGVGDYDGDDNNDAKDVRNEAERQATHDRDNNKMSGTLMIARVRGVAL